MVKEIDLLEAMVLYAAERIAARDVGASSSGVDVMGAARRLHRTFAAMRLAATKGFTHALVEVLRGRYRTLRHDLRNPIGTIRSAIALMDDESLPADIRFGERYRAMVTRNAASLETMITAALGDAQAHGPALTLQDVSLAELARTVRRDLRDDAEAVGCTIELAPTLSAAPLPAVRVDSTAFELVLRSLVDAALDGARRGTVVTVGLRALRDEAASVAVSYVPAARAADHVAPPGELAAPDVSALAVELSRRAGGRVWREDDATLLLEIPVELRVGENATAAVGAAPQPAVADVPTVEGTDSFVAHEMDDAPSRNADQLPRGGGPPGDEVASPR
jgi:signal transduction histidine kinase